MSDRTNEVTIIIIRNNTYKSEDSDKPEALVQEFGSVGFWEERKTRESGEKPSEQGTNPHETTSRESNLRRALIHSATHALTVC